MRLVTLAVSSLSPTVGAVRTNTALVLAEARAMAEAGVSLGAFPEQVLGGYPPEDLVQWRAFLDAQRRALDAFAAATADLPTVFVLGLAVPVDALLFNAAAVVHGGRVLGCVLARYGMPDYIDVEPGLTVAGLFQRQTSGGKPNDYLIRVNRQPTPPDQAPLPLEDVATPGVETIAALAEFLDVEVTPL